MYFAVHLPLLAYGTEIERAYIPRIASGEMRCYIVARYVHFDVRASRRSRKQEKIEICLVRFKSISSREHIHYFRKPA